MDSEEKITINMGDFTMSYKQVKRGKAMPVLV